MNKYLLTFLVFCVSSIVRAQIPTPSVTQSQSGTVVPIQCLGCLPISGMQIRSSVSGYRTPTAGDFVALNANNQIQAIRRQTGPNGEFFSGTLISIADLNQNPLVLNLSVASADWGLLSDVGIARHPQGWVDDVRAIGIYSRQGQPWSTMVMPNGVCKGPVIRIAKQLLTGGDNKPLVEYVVTGYGNPSGQVSAEAGAATLSQSHPLVCTGELIDADSYYKDLVDKQLQEIIRDLASRTSTEKMRTLMQEVLRAYLQDFYKEIVESTARLVVDEMIKRGLVVSSTPIKPPAPNNLKTPPK
jgi:hypothetical protein